MKKVFLCSLCKNGLLGGALYLDEQTITYRTQKLSVGTEYRNMVLPMSGIREITWKWIVFPIASFCMKNGESYSFIIFNKRRFCRCIQSAKSKQG